MSIVWIHPYEVCADVSCCIQCGRGITEGGNPSVVAEERSTNPSRKDNARIAQQFTAGSEWSYSSRSSPAGTADRLLTVFQTSLRRTAALLCPPVPRDKLLGYLQACLRHEIRPQ